MRATMTVKTLPASNSAQKPWEYVLEPVLIIICSCYARCIEDQSALLLLITELYGRVD